jgi:hypothetical protein
MKTTASLALEQLERAGYLSYVLECEQRDNGWRGIMHTDAIPRLMADDCFAHGLLYGLHTDVGKDLIDFRSYNGTFGRGSLQIVIDKRTGAFWADVDAHNPYNDLVRFFGHAFGEVIPHFFQRLFRRAK